MKRFVALLAVGLVALAASPTSASIILNEYKLGEADPGAVAGNPGNANTVDSVGGIDLAKEGSPSYSSSTAAPGSTLSMSFDGASDYRHGSVVTTLTDNVGIDAWVFPTTNNIIATIAYNGDSGSSGYGLYQFNGSGSNATIIGLVGGKTLGPSVNIPLNTWSEVKQIIQGGTDYLYLNGTLVGSVAITGGSPNTPSGYMAIGGHGGEYFQGNIDQVTVFSTVPEPSALVLMVLGGLGFVAVSRRHRAAK